MKTKCLCCTLCCLLVLGGLAFAHPQAGEGVSESSLQKQKIYLGIRNKSDYWGKFTTLVYEEAFRRLQIDLEFRYYPLQRMTNMLDDHPLDGEVSRVKDYNDVHVSLVRVEESHANLDLVAYTADPDLKLDGWESVRGTNLKIGYVFGSKKTSEKLKARVPEENISFVHEYLPGLKMVLTGRIDVFIVSQQGAKEFIENGNCCESQLYIAGVMESIPLHAFLLKKHDYLALQLAKVLREMKAEGLIEQYRKEAEQ